MQLLPNSMMSWADGPL